MKKPSARKRILAKAAALFFQRGYSEVGINEIIDQSGTAKATFYHHFPSKKALCEAWLQEVHERSETFLRELLASDASPVSKVSTYFDSLSAYLIENHFRGCPYSNTAAVTPEEESICQRIREHKESIRNFFHQLAGQLTPRPARAQRLGDALFLLFSGATTEAQNLRLIWPVEVARQTAVDLCEACKD